MKLVVIAASVTAASLAMLAAALPAHADERSESALLRLQAPARLVVGVDRQAVVRLRNPGKPVALAVNVGSISQPIPDGNGLRATYTMPSTRYPQVAVIVAATTDRRVVDFVAIPIHARPTIRVESRPQARVTVQVGGAAFGPIKLNRRGRGKIQLEVPPGIDSAIIEGKDALGNAIQTFRPLGAPPFPRIVPVCPTGGNRLLLVAVTPRGQPLADARFDLAATAGTLAEARPLSPGIYTSRLRVGDGVAFEDTARISATLSGTKSPTVSCEAPIPRELPTGVGISLNRKQYVAGSGPQIIEVTVALSYPGKRLPRRMVPTLRASLGQISNPEAVTQTRFRARWTVPNAFNGKSTAHVVVSIPNTEVESRHALELIGGPPETLTIRASADRMRADPNRRVEITASAADAFGNPTAPDSIALEATAGRLTRATTDLNTVRATYSPLASHVATTDVITARAPSGTRASVSLALEPIPRRFAVTGRLGFATNFGAVATVAAAVDASLRLSIRGHNLAIGVETGFLSTTRARLRDDDVERVSLSLSAIPVLARVAYELNRLPVPLYVGASAGVSFAKARVESDRAGMRTASGVPLTAAGLLGARKRLGRGLVVFEAAYWVSRFDEPGIDGDIGGVRLWGGYGLDF